MSIKIPTVGALNYGITLPMLRQVTRGLSKGSNVCCMDVDALSADYNILTIDDWYVVFCHAGMCDEVSDLPGFVEIGEYSWMRRFHEMEFGASDRFRFVCLEGRGKTRLAEILMYSKREFK